MRKTMMALLQVACVAVPLSVWAGCPSPDDVGTGKGKLYENIDCGGWSVGCNTSSAMADMRHMSGNNQGVNLNDMISSMVIGPGIKCTFYADINYKGASFSQTKGTIASLVKTGWNDKISSYKCVPWNQ